MGAGPASAGLTAPTLAPVLVVTADLGSNTAHLSWSASNKISSPGFYYDIEVDVNGGGYSQITTSTNLSYNNTQAAPAGETYTYRVTPYNSQGGGPSSNTAGVVLPGESDGPELLGPNNTTATQYVTTDFTLTWSSIAGAATYDLYKSTADSGYSLWQADIAATSLAVSYAAAFGVGNWWYVIAHDGAGHYSAQSNHLECTPISANPAARNTEDGTGRELENGTSRILEA